MTIPDIPGNFLLEYLGALEADPGHAAFLHRSVNNQEIIAEKNDIHWTDDEAASWLGQRLDDWEYRESWTVRHGYTSRIALYERDGFELVVRRYTHDGSGREAGTDVTTVWITSLLIYDS